MPFDISGKKIDPQKGHSSPDKNEAGRALIPISPDSRENKPQISLPVAFYNFPSRSREKEVFFRDLRREIPSLFSVLRMAGQGMKIKQILILTLLFI